MVITEMGRFRFYVVCPLRSGCRRVRRLCARILDKVLGRWYCDGCHKHHSGRVVAYYPCDVADGFCYRHVDPREVERYEAIMMGGRNVTQEVKAEYRGIEWKPKPEEDEPPPTVEQARAAGQIIKRFCKVRSEDDACRNCPLRDMCETPPYTWDGGVNGGDNNAV